MRNKKIFYNMLVFIISIGLFSSCSYSKNQQSQKHSKTITIKGNAVINVKPDIAILELEASTTGENIINIQSKNNKIMNNIVDTIVKLGVNKKDIYKSECNLYTTNTSDYNLSSIISVKVIDINKLEEIVSKAIKAGAFKEHYNIEFTVSDYDKYYKEALKKAIEDGNNKAKALSKRLGIDLGAAVKIEEDPYYIGTYNNKNNNFTNINYGERSNIINGRNKLISAYVNMTFQY